MRERRRAAAVGDQGRLHGQGAPCHGRDRQGRRLGPRRQRLRAAAAAAGRGVAGRARRRRDQARPRRPQVCAPCPRRPPRPGAAQPQLRPEADPARAQGRARGRGGDRHARRPTCATCIPSTSSSSGCARRCSRRAAAAAADRRAGEAETLVRLPDGPTAQARHGASPTSRCCASVSSVPRAAGAENALRSRAAGRGQRPSSGKNNIQARRHPDGRARAPRSTACERPAGQARVRLGGAAPDRQHGALALDAGGPGRVPCLGQHPGVQTRVLQEGPGHPYRPRSSSASRDTPTAVFSANMKLRRVPPRVGRARLHQAQGDRALSASGRRQGFFGSSADRHLDPGAAQPARQSTMAARSMPAGRTGARWTSAASPSSSRRGRTTCWASSSSASPTSTTSTCTTRRSASCSRRRCAPSATAASACTIPGAWPSCCSRRTRAGRPRRCAACWPRATTTR